jgi:hypothetical protein
MTRRPIFILQTPLSDESLLDEFVETCIRENVCHVATVGEGCDRIMDIIGEITVGDGTHDWDESRFIAASSHADDTLEEVMQFAELIQSLEDFPTEIRVVRI